MHYGHCIQYVCVHFTCGFLELQFNLSWDDTCLGRVLSVVLNCFTVLFTVSITVYSHLQDFPSEA